MISNTECLKELKEMKENTVDFVFTDPPYNVGKKYDTYYDKLSPEQYDNFMFKVLYDCERISKNGIAVLYPGYKIKLLFAWIANPRIIVLHKRAQGIKIEGFYNQYHVIATTATPINPTHDLWNDIRLPGEGYFFTEKRYDNPGMTSLKLTRKVIETFTEPGQTVLDPFMGTGTTAVACKLLDRKYKGFEISKRYTEIAMERLRELGND